MYVVKTLEDPKERATLISDMSTRVQNVHYIIEMIVVCALAFVQSGLLDFVFGGRHLEVSSRDMLESNLLALGRGD